MREKRYLCKCDGTEGEVEDVTAAGAAERYATSLHAEGDDFLSASVYRVKVSLAGDEDDGEVDVYKVNVKGEVQFTSSVELDDEPEAA